MVAWRTANNPLSNFNICTMAYGDCVFKSSEHFYQHEFCMFMKRNVIAQQVLDAAPHREAKQVAAQLKSLEHSTNLAKCAPIKVYVMAFILKVKWNQCAKFRQALISTERMTICEATSCDYWGVGTWHSTQNNHSFWGKIIWVNYRWLFDFMFLGMEYSMARTIDDWQDSSLEIGVLPSFLGQELMKTNGSEASISNEEIPPPVSSTLITSRTPTTTTIPQPTNNSAVSPNTATLRPPRRIAAVRSSKINTPDNFIIRDSSTKRKPSGEAASH